MEYSFKSHDGTVRRASPVRDIAYFTPELLVKLKDLLENRLSDSDIAYLGNDRDRLMEGFARLCTFVSNSIVPSLRSPMEAITAAGFLDLPESVKRVVLEKFCIVLLGAFWAGIRSSVVLEEPVPVTIACLQEFGTKFLEALTKA